MPANLTPQYQKAEEEYRRAHALLVFNGSSDDAPDETAAVVPQLEARKTHLARDSGFGEDDLSTVRIKSLLVATHGDDPGCDDRLAYFQEVWPNSLPVMRVEFDRPESRDALRDAIYEALVVIRVYTKRPGHPAELADPFTIPRGGTVDDLAVKVHREMAEKLKFAKVWGTSARDGQSCGREHLLCDKDVVELHW